MQMLHSNPNFKAFSLLAVASRARFRNIVLVYLHRIQVSEFESNNKILLFSGHLE